MKVNNTFAGFEQFALSTEEANTVKGGGPGPVIWYCEYIRHGTWYSVGFSSAGAAMDTCHREWGDTDCKCGSLDR